VQLRVLGDHLGLKPEAELAPRGVDVFCESAYALGELREVGNPILHPFSNEVKEALLAMGDAFIIFGILVN
jgi:hypothetical protein